MQRLLAILLVLIGLIGLVLGRLGETTWAPATEVTATVQLEDPGPAVVIDPGVLYLGGTEGTVEITGASEVSVITAPAGDVTAYLEETRYTRVTGASDWSTLSTEAVNPEGEDEIADPTSSDLWLSVETSESPVTLQVADVAAAEHGENEQPYRPLLLVTDGTAPGAESITITWPVEDENEWVPYAYAGGAAIAVIGLVLFLVSLGSARRRREDEELGEDVPAADADTDDTVRLAAVPAGAAGTATEVLAPTRGTDEDPDAPERPAADPATGADRTETLAPVANEDPETARGDGPPAAEAFGPGDDALGGAPRGEDDTDVLAPVRDSEDPRDPEDPEHGAENPHHTPEENR